MTHSITVYIPSYNHIQYLGPAIESVLAQTRLPDQILIVDDASTDGSDKLIREYQRKHPGLIDVIINETNQGLGSIRRIAVNASTGDLITYLDADDLYLPRKIELEERALVDHPKAGYSYSNYCFVNEHGDDQGVWSASGELPSGDVFERLCCFQFPQGVASRCELVRKELLVQTDHYESGLNLYQCHDVMLRIARISTCVAIENSTHAYRRHAQGVHRIPYTVHYDTLNHIYTKNKDLLDGLDDRPKQRLQSKIDSILSGYAWRAIKQMSKNQSAENHRHVLQYARAGFTHNPASVLNPKRPLRVLRALAKA